MRERWLKKTIPPADGSVKEQKLCTVFLFWKKTFLFGRSEIPTRGTLGDGYRKVRTCESVTETKENERRSRRAEEANRCEEKIRVSVVSGVWWVYLEKVESLQHHHHHSRIVQCGVSNILHFLSDLQNNIIVCRAEAEYSELAGRNRVCMLDSQRRITNITSINNKKNTKNIKNTLKYINTHPREGRAETSVTQLAFGWFDSSRAEKRTDQNYYDPPSLRGTTWQRSSDQPSRRPSGTGCHRTSTFVGAGVFASKDYIILFWF